MIPFASAQEDDKLINLAFGKEKAHDQKEWLRQFKVSQHPQEPALSESPAAWNISDKPGPGKHLIKLFKLTCCGESREISCRRDNYITL